MCRNEPYKRLENGELILEIYIDEVSMSPREWDNIGFLGMFERWADKATDTDILKDYEFTYFKKVAGYLKKYHNSCFALPIIKGYDKYYIGTIDANVNHDNIVGFMYTTKERIKELCGEDPQYYTDEFLKCAFVSEIVTFSQWANGEVFGYILSEKAYCEHCEHSHINELNSVWGFYGDDFEVNGLFEDAGWSE